MMGIYVALGSNIEPRHLHLEKALTMLEEHSAIQITNQSSIYKTAPVGYTDQADFLNMVIELNTDLSAIELLDVCQSIELQLGRKREIRFGPRTIDLDILIFNNENRETKRLIIPHPRMHERAFVLVPLAEIEPNLCIPNQNKSVTDLVKELSAQDKKDVTRWTQSDSVEE
ncbi:2-amino-4-hydroxy-6-hydroxymethyldihydropteridine diphosphokinase [Lentibacillus sp. Marseille-P4043]|uniref:2-amino-4-hydroxy-6- hydroxymethyldihydropteridine diphosphokinase n=1 Tax=Lentibacillus sp. Marseille-P4043 TaxID=2040293 RepID=UPI000D0B4F06|nr:2-amino-4-hydroxy-6-hydroxymethyldihydropteridine diphosphokinase [Lentibacillus sp. Marseille-P4043]